ncbi:MAG: type II toxin-antitoxin system VapC family toxin [Acidimicrobiia bacterium]|nr:type II toxin-antitoxin system VapC family toxin [Acidimicrobiia bacterium]
MIVLDASATVDLLVGGSSAERIARRLDGEVLCAPALLDVEVVSALRSLERRGKLSDVAGTEALNVLESLGVARYTLEAFAGRMWELRETLSAYDAAYVALAEALTCPLLTCDGRLARSHGHDADVETPN